MAAEKLNAVLAAVGPRLRDARNGRGLTLAEVGEQSGISVSTLSRLEAGLRRPTLDHLLPLAQIYRVPLDDLVGAPASGDPRIHPRPIRRHGAVYIPLTRQASGVRAFKIVLPGRRGTDAAVAQPSHGGYDWLYVLTGTLRLHLGDSVTDIAAGEAAEFDTRTPHGMVSATGDPVELICLFSPQGEQIHVRES